MEVRFDSKRNTVAKSSKHKIASAQEVGCVGIESDVGIASVAANGVGCQRLGSGALGQWQRSLQQHLRHVRRVAARATLRKTSRLLKHVLPEQPRERLPKPPKPPSRRQRLLQPL